jgi:hypothetical protein
MYCLYCLYCFVFCLYDCAWIWIGLCFTASFRARVNICRETSQHGLYDVDFLNAPKPTFGIQTIENLIAKLQDRQVEVKAADQMTKLINPDLPGRQAGERGKVSMRRACESRVVFRLYR